MADQSYFNVSRRWWESSRRARGDLDLVEFTSTTVAIAGWLLLPDQRVETIAVYVDDLLIGEQSPGYREDIKHLFSHVPHAGLSAFGLTGNFTVGDAAFVSVTIVGTLPSGERVLLQRYRLTRVDLPDRLPDERLRTRVAGTGGPKVFAESGADNALQFIGFLRRHLRASAAPRILDWGCGAGRIDRYMLRFWPDIVLTGCDIDAEAVEWCNRNLNPGAFHATTPLPPLPFADGSFDAVFGYSVMTHLPWSLQKQWLAEIRRILIPGGVFATSVHGSFATNLDPETSVALESSGFLDKAPDSALDGVAPQGYYRTVYQTPAFTREHWGRQFAVIDYLEGGLSALHDLVVLRRPE